MKYVHIIGAVLLLAVAIVVVLEARSFGFPDGALTELERAEQPLYYGFAAVSGGCAGLLLLLPARARPRVWAAYVVIAASVVWLDRHFVASLPGGGGG